MNGPLGLAVDIAKAIPRRSIETSRSLALALAIGKAAQSIGPPRLQQCILVRVLAGALIHTILSVET